VLVRLAGLPVGLEVSGTRRRTLLLCTSAEALLLLVTNWYVPSRPEKRLLFNGFPSRTVTKKDFSQLNTFFRFVLTQQVSCHLSSSIEGLHRDFCDKSQYLRLVRSFVWVPVGCLIAFQLRADTQFGPGSCTGI